MRRVALANLIVGLWAGQVAGWAGTAAATSASDIIWLNNGERLRGELINLDQQRSVLWRHPDIAEPVAFPLQGIDRIRFGGRTAEKSNEANPCLVRLVGQDELEGDLLALTSSNAVLQTWYAGTLNIPRNCLDSIQPIVKNPKVLYTGPTSMDGWTIGNSGVLNVDSNAWTYREGAFVANTSGSIAKDVKLPGVAAIEFDLAWTDYLTLAVAVYADSLQPMNLNTKDDAPEFGGFYSLQIHANMVQVLCVRKGMPLNRLDVALVQGLENRHSAHVAIRVNKAERALYLYLDGALVKSWRDSQDTVGNGTILRFVNQAASLLRISNLVVSEWDGRLDAPAENIDNATNDFVRLINHDTVGGELQRVEKGTAHIKSSLGPLEVPLARVEQIHFAQNSRKLPPATEGTYKAVFAGKGHLSLKLEGWEGKDLIVTHPALGRLHLAPAALRWLEFKTADAGK